MKLELYFAPGSCSRVSLIALEQIGLPYEPHLVAFMRGEHKSPAYLARNPAGKVPMLVADGHSLAQTTAILVFLARSFPDAGLIPFTGDTLDDGRLLSDLVWCSADLHQLVTRIRLPQMACDVPEATVRVRALAETAMTAQLAHVEARLTNQPWLWGERWSVFDAYVYWVWFRITGAGFPSQAFPNLCLHRERMEARPAVQRALHREAAAEQELATQGAAVPFDLAKT